MVFMRSKLYGTGQRNVQTQAYVTIEETYRIRKQIADGTENFSSLSITILI